MPVSRVRSYALLTRLPCLLLYDSNNQIPRYKLQTKYKFKIMFIILKIGYCNLFDFCFLVIGISVVKQQAFDLHALSTPPAFILSQGQTLKKNKSFNDSLFGSLAN